MFDISVGAPSGAIHSRLKAAPTGHGHFFEIHQPKARKCSDSSPQESNFRPFPSINCTLLWVLYIMPRCFFKAK